MKDTTATVAVLVTLFLVVGGIFTQAIQSDRHNGDNTHKTSIECIKAGKEWRKIAPAGRTSPYWACVSPKGDN